MHRAHDTFPRNDGSQIEPTWNFSPSLLAYTVGVFWITRHGSDSPLPREYGCEAYVCTYVKEK